MTDPAVFDRDVPWDPHLAATLAEHGVAVPEERVAPVLLDDLAAHTQDPGRR